MSRFKNEVVHLSSHVRTLRYGLAGMFVVTLVLGAGWWNAPRNLTIHVPPDLRTGSMRKWWDIPPESVYAFAMYVFQGLQRWPANGEEDYPRNVRALSAYLTPACKHFLEEDFATRRNNGELQQRTRGVYEIPGRAYADDPLGRVKYLSRNDWLVTLDLAADEYYGAEQVKRVFIRYPIRVQRMDVDPKHNPFGLALACYDRPPERIDAPAAATPKAHEPKSQEELP